MFEGIYLKEISKNSILKNLNKNFMMLLFEGRLDNNPSKDRKSFFL